MRCRARSAAFAVRSGGVINMQAGNHRSHHSAAVRQRSRACCCSARCRARNRARSRFFLRPPAATGSGAVLAAVLGEEAPGLHRGQARDVPAGTMWRCGTPSRNATSRARRTRRSATPSRTTSAACSARAKLTRIFATGGKSAQLYRKAHRAENRRAPITQLPSTSPANAAWSLERLDRSVPRYSI